MSKLNVGGGAVVGAAYETTAALTAGAAVSVDCSRGGIFTLTPGEDETLTATNVTVGEKVTLVVLTSGVTSRTLTFGTGFKTTGTLATGTTTAKYFVVEFVAVSIASVNTLVETSRTTAQ